MFRLLSFQTLQCLRGFYSAVTLIVLIAGPGHALQRKTSEIVGFNVKKGTISFADQSLSYLLADLEPNVVASKHFASVLLLHGAKFDSTNWLKTGTIQSLHAAGYRVIAIDLPGYGKSPRLPYQDSNLRAEVIRTALDFIGGKLKAILTPSMSGRYAIPFVERYGLNLTSWIAVAPVGIGRWAGPPDTQTKELNVLGLYGDRDPLLKHAQRLRHMFPRCRVETLADASHACYQDNPQLFNRLVLAFLKVTLNLAS